MDHDVKSKELTRLKTWTYKLLQTRDCFLASIRLFDLDEPWKSEPDFKKDFKDIAPLLYYMSLAGLYSTTESLLVTGVDVNAVSHGRYGTALQAAAGEGHETIVRQLLNAGADIDAVARGQDAYSTALQQAADRGHAEIVQRLLDAGADVNIAAHGLYGTALQAAAGAGHKIIVQQLLDAGADVNAVSEGYYSTPLEAAAAGGFKEIVQKLLDAGADVEAVAKG